MNEIGIGCMKLIECVLIFGKTEKIVRFIAPFTNDIGVGGAMMAGRKFALFFKFFASNAIPALLLI